MTGLSKVSVTIGGHRTSLSLEPAFWRAFAELCRAEGRSRAAVLAEIDGARRSNLSSAVRLWVLERLRRGARLSAAG